jgi:hypothetical protein
MSAERIMVLGYDRPGLRSEGIFGDANLSEADVIFFEMKGLEATLSSLATTQVMSGQSLVPHPAAAQLERRLKQRLDEIVAWAYSGHSLFIMMDAWMNILLQDSAAKHKPLVITHFSPFSSSGITRNRGTRVRCCATSQVCETLSVWVPKIEYQALVMAKGFEPMLEVDTAKAGTRQPVGGFFKVGAGRMFFLPPLAQNFGVEVAQYYRALASIPDRLKEPREALPEWTHAIQTETEASALATIRERETEITKLSNEISAATAIIEEEQSLKRLFASTGDEFLAAVHDALERIGFKVVSVPGKRADKLAYDEGRLLAVEAKGLDRGAKEEDVRQANRWVADVQTAVSATEETLRQDPDLSNYMKAILEIEPDLPNSLTPEACKGLLVIGTFRKVPLDQRSEVDFPDSVSRVISRSELCAMTGLQLLELVIRARTSPEDARKLREEIFTTVGQHRTKAWSGVA